MHTLPLPKVRTDNTPNTQPEVSPASLTPHPGSPAPACSRMTPQQLQFLLRVTPPALQSQREYEIPACITIAQAILESATPKLGWGSSSLFRIANNPFGIKYCHFSSGLGVRDSGLGKEDSKSQIPNSKSPVPSPQFQVLNTESSVPNTKSQIPNSVPPVPSPQPRSPRITATSTRRPGKSSTARRWKCSRSSSVSPIWTKPFAPTRNCCARRTTGPFSKRGVIGNSLRRGWDLKTPSSTRSIVGIPQIPATPHSLLIWLTPGG